MERLDLQQALQTLTDPQALIDQAWLWIYLEPLGAARLGARAAELAAAQDDASRQAWGLFHDAFGHIRYGDRALALPKLEDVRARFTTLGDQRGLWMCEEADSIRLRRGGQFEEAWAVSDRLMRIPYAERGWPDPFCTHVSHSINSRLLGRFEVALRAYYGGVELAEQHQDLTLESVAVGNLGSVLFDLYNTEEALPFMVRGLELANRVGSRLAIGTAVANLLSAYYQKGEHGKAMEVLQTYMFDPVKVDPKRLPELNAEIAMTYLAGGQLDEAELWLSKGVVSDSAAGPNAALWTWVKGRLLMARGHFEEARELCQRRIDLLRKQQEFDLPYDLMQMYGVVGGASEALQDYRTALFAQRDAYQMRDQLVSRSLRSQRALLEMDHQLEQSRLAQDVAQARQAQAESDRARLEELNIALEEARSSLEERVAQRTAELSRAKQTAEAALEARSRFLANMSHEIRTPLNGVLGVADLLLKSELAPQQRDLVQVLAGSGRVLLKVLNDILDFSKIEADKIVLDLEPFELARTISEVGELFAASAHEKDIDLGTLVDVTLPAVVLGDSVRISQVLGNLLGNAIKFTERGSVQLRVTPGASPGMVRFAVRDTGPGIAPAAQREIFEPFRQADASATRRYGGTGLGLSIARELVQRMGGDMQLKSQPGEGCEFSVELPLAAVHVERAPVPESSFADTQSPSPDGLRVLLVEDNAVNQMVASAMLSESGHQVVVAGNGREAVDLSTEQDFDVVLMDWQMPVMDGLTATSLIRAREAQHGGRRLWIIGLTANAMVSDRESCIAAGMDDYLAKPFSMQQIHAALKRARLG
jgi:signal transduction histidine kinase/ActR/RegA family two-component response regulator